MSFAAVDKRGDIIDRDKDLTALQERQAEKVTSSVGRVAGSSGSSVVEAWTNDTLGAIDEEVITTVDGQKVVAYPALAVTPQGVSIQVLPTKAAADASMMTATLTLLMRDITVSVQRMLNGLPLKQRVAVEHYPHGGATGLVDDARVTAIRDAMLEAGGPARSPDEFEQLRATIAPTVPATVRQIVVQLAPALVDYHDVVEELKRWSGDAIDDMTAQLEFLLPPHAISVHGMSHLKHLPRYLQAMLIRLEDMETHPDRDADNQDIIADVTDYIRQRLAQLPSSRAKSREVKNVWWMVEELRVSLFVQRLGTAHAVSERRIQKAVDKLR